MLGRTSLCLSLFLIVLVLALSGCGESAPPVPVANCSDSIQNQNETSMDCGGPCSPCGNGKSCLVSKDCESNNCVSGLCKAIESCTDKLKNQDETDVDCGGLKCGKCAKGKKCSSDTDCDALPCTSGLCNNPPEPSCSDQLKNQDEVDVDCGGSKCGTCGLGKKCAADTDCAEGSCIDGSCQVPSGDCTNRKMDGEETDIDCGGPCPKKCVNGRYCKADKDCASDLCVEGKCGAGVSCKDKKMNQDESDMDCGGKCTPCPLGKDCKADTDCQSGYCASNRCQTMPPADCTNKMRDKDETDVDCGGTMCSACAVNKTCRIGVDCQSSTCSNGICLP